jgi:hypothetical protein
VVEESVVVITVFNVEVIVYVGSLSQSLYKSESFN